MDIDIDIYIDRYLCVCVYICISEKYIYSNNFLKI